MFAVMMWFDIIAFSAAILVGVLFLYGALVRGHKLHAQVTRRLLIGVAGAVLLYFAMHALVRALAR